MSFKEDEYLQLSGIQHFAFCPRQWALIHLEQQWAENYRTADGSLIHETAHNGSRESRGDLLIVRGLSISSTVLGISGQCDVVEFHRSTKGIPLPDRPGLWLPYPVEYKRGKPKEHDADALQLCAQAMCLEEMLCCTVPGGALYYNEPRRRTKIMFTPELRNNVQALCMRMHELYRRGHTPQAKKRKACNACSLYALCLPKLFQSTSVSDYLNGWMEDSAT